MSSELTRHDIDMSIPDKKEREREQPYGLNAKSFKKLIILLLIFAIWLYSSEVSSFGFQLTINMSH
jgi:hypothetical protein